CATSAVCANRLAARSRSISKDRKSTRLNSSHSQISYAVFCLKKKKKNNIFIVLFLHKPAFTRWPMNICDLIYILSSSHSLLLHSSLSLCSVILLLRTHIYSFL